jgi:O-methyltransferase involved in polyketide biosynthesis
VFASESPVCAVERVPLDLRDTSARRGLFQRLGREAKRVLVVSEGLIVYFEADGAAELARDLSAPFSFRLWVTDLTSPALLKMLQRAISSPLVEAGSPLKFAPHEGPGFFARYGWKVVETRSLLQTAAKLKRRLACGCCRFCPILQAASPTNRGAEFACSRTAGPTGFRFRLYNCNKRCLASRIIGVPSPFHSATVGL